MTSEDTTAIAAALTASKRAHSENEDKANPIVSFFVNIMQMFPLPKNENKPKVAELDKHVIKEVVEERKSNNSVVTFPKKEELPSFKLQAEDAHKSTNPVLLWQVYAIGGFFVLRWAWSRWNERKGKKKPSNEERSTEEPPNEDPPPPHS
ncbi:hypothetical protein LIER_04163 [Lithospermum erythrorhizon]|uniref:Uncharacterized protein n=1 Tax=Lithospermum erythrorhizon TaxID=34254 RepID=A0AAV3NXC9_LITER